VQHEPRGGLKIKGNRNTQGEVRWRFFWRCEWKSEELVSRQTTVKREKYGGAERSKSEGIFQIYNQVNLLLIRHEQRKREGKAGAKSWEHKEGLSHSGGLKRTGWKWKDDLLEHHKKKKGS